ncbi:Protein of unknown function DUF2414 [Phaffia rhodozyma]|uniref:Chromatin target of PRMT1 protein C-terminal domain-containing protein n=1 Tax=Phaffia rhodozyma TaxID=264483 RepID=A0A0F7STE1_PHARH|nr:Protein of unknown function DUF2414 [Phaffia rhodozyma]
MNNDEFSYPGGLPYDGDDESTVPLPRPSAVDNSVSSSSRADLLDRPLDDFIQDDRSSRPRRQNPASNSFDRPYRQARPRNYSDEPPTPKIYLLSELNPVINHKMASDLMESKGREPELEEESSLPPPPLDDPSIRRNALYFEGSPLTELPTEKVFTYITSFSTSLPLGIEWISDDRLCAVFPSQTSASVALSALLLKPVEEVLENSRSLLDATADSQYVPTFLWPAEMRPGPARSRVDEMGEGKDDAVMRARMGIRWAKTTDKKAGRAHNASSFYRKHGQSAGRPKIEHQPGNPTDDRGDDLLSGSFTIDSTDRHDNERRRRRSDRSASPRRRETLRTRLDRSASPDAVSGEGSKMRAFGGDLEGRIGEFHVERRRNIEYDPRRSDRWTRNGEEEVDDSLVPVRMSRVKEDEEERRDGRTSGGRGGRRTEQRKPANADDLDKELEEFLKGR